MFLPTRAHSKPDHRATVRGIPAERTLQDDLHAGLVAGMGSGAPSTCHALLTGGNPVEASLAAGSLILPGERRPLRLLFAALPVHFKLSTGWGLVLSRVLPRRPTV